MPRTLALRVFAALLLAAGVFPLANLLTEGRAVPWFGGAAREWLERGALLVVFALGVAYLLGPRLDRLLDRARAALLRPSPGAFGLAVAVAALAASAFVSLYAFAGQPFTSDEMAQAWHARIFASGHLAAVAESQREFFNTAPVLDVGGRWFSQYPAGGPALIALGALVGAPWLVNPVLMAIATWALYRFFAAVGDELRARGAALLVVASPMVLVMAGSQMNHVAALTGVALALWAVSRWDSALSARELGIWALVSGVCLGLVATIRPLDAVVVAALLGAMQAWRAAGEPKRGFSLAIQAASGAAPVAVLLWVNAQTTGSATLFGYDALNGAAHGLGFHVDPTGEMHTPLRGVVLVTGYLMKLSLYLFEWPLPGTAVIAAGMLAVARPSRWDAVMAGLLAAILAAYGAYWFDGFFAGPRFLFTAVPALVYFAVRMPDLVGATAPLLLRRAMPLVLPLCVVVAWFGPWGVSSASSRIALYREQRTKLKTPVEEQVREAGLKNALVFVTEGWRGELLARLRVLGASQFMADRMVTTMDACALQTVLDRERSSSDADSTKLARVIAFGRSFGAPQPVPNLPADQAIALVPGTSPTPPCLAAFSRDSMGTMPYALFLARQTVGADGRIGGDVVFARDLGERNAELRQRFGDRTWYRYRPSPAPVTAPVFVPYR
jgi:hypothetical protein